MNRLLIDIGSTYFKVCANDTTQQFMRDFNKRILDDLQSKCSDILQSFSKEDTYICSSANGGLSTLIIGMTHSFSLKFATNIAFNSGINIIDTVLYPKIGEAAPPSELVDVVIVVGGIDGVGGMFDDRLVTFLQNVRYHNIVYVGNRADAEFLREHIEGIEILGNIISPKLQVEEEELKHYLTNLYQENIIAKEDIKELYTLTANQIFPTPYIVNCSLPHLHTRFNAVEPSIVIDIGGATTDIHFSKDLVNDNIITENEYDRMVFKKLGVYKSRESLIFSARNNEFVYELLAYLDVGESILEERSETSLHILMQLSIFLVLYKVSDHHNAYIDLRLDKLESIIFTGGITKVLSDEEIQAIVYFFYKKIIHFHHMPAIVIDRDYTIWTLGFTG